jgi:hypothetical protein
MIEKVSDERLDVLVQQRAHDEEWYLTELQTFYLLRELQEWRSGKRKRWQDEVTCTISADLSGLDAALASAAAALGRAAEREQAAPEPRKPAKWQRRLRKIDGSLRYNAKDDQWEVWWEPQRGDVMDTVDFGKTPKAAVEAAWKAWKEERGE